jgi:hypothetical protein
VVVQKPATANPLLTAMATLVAPAYGCSRRVRDQLRREPSRLIVPTALRNLGSRCRCVRRARTCSCYRRRSPQSGRALTGAVSCAVADHEIAHSKLYQDEGGRHHTAVRLIHWICRRDGCPVAWLETARRLSLYTEVYCDIAGYLVTGNRDTSTGRNTTSSRKCTAGRAAATTWWMRGIEP